MILSRDLRTRPRNGLAVTDLLTTLLLAEMIDPSPELWLVSGWITDIPVIDNRHHQYDAALGGAARTTLMLSEVLAEVTSRGTSLHLALRIEQHNEWFIRRVQERIPSNRLHLHESAELHEKLIVGRDWIMKGSMNFTVNGTQLNEEKIQVVHDERKAAQERLELQTRWIGQA
ncbi:phospholipase D-like domain-containing protein DpdK [Nocardioides yefusunii]|uniref:Phospholipase D-like domain-containing protein DpdK n=1 Tax=Nocardioides yefusunii TaxID=2500546 RepID=A0ABW1R031_9ACTN|nr:phospholipase D-like domain-containing protein DpdK [Nocardioides yefusunii]